MHFFFSEYSYLCTITVLIRFRAAARKCTGTARRGMALRVGRLDGQSIHPPNGPGVRAEGGPGTPCALMWWFATPGPTTHHFASVLSLDSSSRASRRRPLPVSLSSPTTMHRSLATNTSSLDDAIRRQHRHPNPNWMPTDNRFYS